MKCMYRLCMGSVQASILHMAEMIFLAYAMGYAQVYLLSNFDEGERLGIKEIAYVGLCSFIYAGISVLGGWFGKAVWVSVLFFYIWYFYIFAYSSFIRQSEGLTTR